MAVLSFKMPFHKSYLATFLTSGDRQSRKKIYRFITDEASYFLSPSMYPAPVEVIWD